MKLIQPNCRIQFTATDIEFIVSTLAKKTGDAGYLVKLLTDEETRDTILDSDELYQALLEYRGCLPISVHFYFYVLVRHVLRRTGINDRSVADYIAEVLAEFSRAERSQWVVPGSDTREVYLFEMVAALQSADDRGRFSIRANIGNHSLFLAGVFPERIKFRAEMKGFPSMSYYEALGQSSFRAASDHRLADRYALGPIFTTLADRFQEARVALNDVAQRLFSIGDIQFNTDSLIQHN